MYITKFLAFAAVAILLGGILSNVAGQKIRNPPPPAEPPVTAETVNRTDISKVSAIEVSPGETNYAVATTYGATYYGQTSSDLPGSLFISMNYKLAEDTPYQGASGSTSDRPQPISQTSEVTGGSWTRVIFKNGEYVGSVYGRIVGGKVTWSSTDLTANISLDLAVDNGTEVFVDSTGKGTFEGKLDRMGKVATVSGLLTLEY